MALRTLMIAAAAGFSALGLSGCAHAASPPPQERASIPFAAIGNIKFWTAPNERTILVQAENGQWYRADLMATCLDLTTANDVGFVTDPDLSLTKFGSVLVHGRRCWFKDFKKIPTPKSEQHKEK